MSELVTLDLFTAVDEVAKLTAADQAPELSSDELEEITGLYVRVDGSYAIRRAAAEGWRRKAAKAAGAFAFSTGGMSVDRTMIVKHCLLMAEHYDREAGRRTRVRSLTMSPVGWL